MAGGIFNRMLKFIGFEDDDELEQDVRQVGSGRESSVSVYRSEPRNGEDNVVPLGRRKPASGQVVNLQQAAAAKQVRLVVARPRSFDEVQVIADHLKNRRPVVVNLEEVEAMDEGGRERVAQRILDFLSGTIYALNGSMQKVGKQNVFVFVPQNMDITAEYRTFQHEREE